MIIQKILDVVHQIIAVVTVAQHHTVLLHVSVATGVHHHGPSNAGRNPRAEMLLH